MLKNREEREAEKIFCFPFVVPDNKTTIVAQTHLQTSLCESLNRCTTELTLI